MSEYTCTNCGETVHLSRKFCGKCGAINEMYEEPLPDFTEDDLRPLETFMEMDQFVIAVQNRAPEVPVTPNILDQMLRDFLQGKGAVSKYAKEALIQHRPRAAARHLVPAALNKKIFDDKSSDALEILAAIGDPDVIPQLLNDNYHGDDLFKMLLIVGVNKDPKSIAWLGKRTANSDYGSLAIKLLEANNMPETIDALIMNASGIYYDFVDEAISYRPSTFLGSLAKTAINVASEAKEKQINKINAYSLMFYPYNPLEVFSLLKSNVAITFNNERLRLKVTADKITKTPNYPFKQNLMKGLPQIGPVYYLLISLALLIGNDEFFIEDALKTIIKRRSFEPPHDVGMLLINEGIMQSRSTLIRQKYAWFPEHFVTIGDICSMAAVSSQAVVNNYQPLADNILRSNNLMIDVPVVAYSSLVHKNPIATSICQSYQGEDKSRYNTWKDAFLL